MPNNEKTKRVLTYNYNTFPGTTKLENLNINIGSMSVKLTNEDLKEISDAVPIDEVAGDRELSMMAKYVWKYANTPLKS